MGYIYKITNLINNKVYIGLTICSINKRWREHKSHVYNSMKRTYLYNAMRKYGIDNFKIEIIEECDNSLLKDKEREYIKLYHSYIKDPLCNGYNLTPGGEGTDFEAHEEIFKLWDNGYSVGQIAKEINYNRNSVNKILKDYHNFSIEESQKRAHKLSGITKGKPVIQLDLEGNFIKEFPSMAEAERQTKISCKNISKIINHKPENTAGGYKWKLKE